MGMSSMYVHCLHSILLIIYSHVPSQCEYTLVCKCSLSVVVILLLHVPVCSSVGEMAVQASVGSFEFSSFVCGHHVYSNVWTPVVD